MSIVKRSKGEEGEEREALNDARQPITRQLITKSVSIKRNCVGETKLHVAVIKVYIYIYMCRHTSKDFGVYIMWYVHWSCTIYSFEVWYMFYTYMIGLHT